MKLIVNVLTTLAGLVLAGGCTHTSVYQKAANEIISGNTSNPLQLQATWYSFGRSPDARIPAETNQNFFDVLDSCAEKLESEKLDFMGRLSPNISIATIQLLDCVNKNNWEIEIVQTILLH